MMTRHGLMSPKRIRSLIAVGGPFRTTASDTTTGCSGTMSGRAPTCRFEKHDLDGVGYGSLDTVSRRYELHENTTLLGMKPVASVVVTSPVKRTFFSNVPSTMKVEKS